MTIVVAPDDIVKYMPSAFEGCPHYQMGKGTACITEKRHAIDAVVEVSNTEHQLLEISVYMLHGDTRKDIFWKM